MGKRTRAREAADTGETSPRDIMRSGYARGEARNEEIRRNLEPVEEGERPGAVTVGAIVALLLAVVNGVAVALGEAVGGDDAFVPGTALSVVLLVCAVGMWQARYWAVLGFQALLTIQIIISAGALLVASSVWAAFLSLVFVSLGGWLFWKLIRALARLQMPQQ